MKKIYTFAFIFICTCFSLPSKAQKQYKNNISLIPVSTISNIKWNVGISYERYLDAKNKWMFVLPIYTFFETSGMLIDAEVQNYYNFQVVPGIVYHPFTFKRSDIHYGIGLSYLYHQKDYQVTDYLFNPPTWETRVQMHGPLLINRLDFDINKRLNLGVSIGLGYGLESIKQISPEKGLVFKENGFMGQFQMKIGYRF